MSKIVSKIIFLTIIIAAILSISRKNIFYDYIYHYKACVLSQQDEEFKQKFWAHWVNSIGKVREASHGKVLLRAIRR